MKKLTIILILILAVFVTLSATITYSSITSKSSGNLAYYSGTTTVAVADTAANYIVSPTFTTGYKLSGKAIMIIGTVTTALQHSAAKAVGILKGVLQVSADNSTFADVASLEAYPMTGCTAGSSVAIPASTIGMVAPYYRIKWVGYSAAGVLYTADIFGAIKTTIITYP